MSHRGSIATDPEAASKLEAGAVGPGKDSWNLRRTRRDHPVHTTTLLGVAKKKHVALDAAAAGGLAAAGYAITQYGVGEPYGVMSAILGLEVAAVGTAIATHLADRHFESAHQATGHALDLAALDGEQLLAWVKSDDRNAAFLERAIRAAYETIDGHKARTIGRVLADALIDGTKIDINALVIETLRRLEAGHVRVLRTFVELPAPPGNGWRVSELAEVHRGLLVAMDSLTATLAGVGCITRANGTYADQAEGTTPYKITNFGRACLDPAMAERWAEQTN